jgi:uncharacterized repeat protein (TIGR02543 family)
VRKSYFLVCPSRPFGWLVCTLLIVANGTLADTPAWWQTRGVLQTNATPNDYAALNAGQLKQLAFAAWQELETFPGSAGFLPSFTNAESNYAAVNIGQLKEVARPFYDRLVASGTASNYTWINSATTNNYAVANIGQAKNLFSFSPVADTNVFLVIDLSGGSEALAYPVSVLKDIPPEGWSDEYKTSKLVLRKIRAGAFARGSSRGELGHCPDEPQYAITLTKDFYIGVFEVTQRQWELVMGNRPSYFTNNSYYATRPVEQVSYYDLREKPGNSDDPAVDWPSNSMVNATSFMGKLRAKTGLWEIDLPTEAQWEYACRAWTMTALNNGMNLTNVYQDASMASVGRYFYNGDPGVNQDCATNAGTVAVGSYPPNAWGLYDMHGNVLEWCLDGYGPYPGASSDPSGAASNSQRGRVLRGGAYWMPAFFCRSAARSYMSPETALDGFRVATAVLPDTMHFVVFNAGAGTVSPAAKPVTLNEPYCTLPVPSRSGHSFNGWWTAAGGTGTEVTANTLMTTASNHTLYAKWTAYAPCTVSFNTQGLAATPSQKTVTFGEEYGTLPSIVSTNRGYSFGGWWTGVGGTGTEVTVSTVVATDANHTLHAKWIGNTYRVSHSLGYGSVSPAPKTVTYGMKYLTAVPAIASRPGYTIGFWWTGPNGTGTQVTPVMTVATAADHTLYAKWTANTYTASFDASLPGSSGGSYHAPKTVTYGAAYGVLPVASDGYYSFDGWWTNSLYRGSAVTENTAVAVAANHTLYAKWIVKTSCTVVFAAEGGTVSPAWRDVDIDQPYGTLPAPTRAGYLFGGWWTGSGGTGALATENTTVTAKENHVIYAKWTQDGGPSYMVVDLAGGSSAANYPVSYLTAAPPGEWTDEYKTSKLVLRRIPAGTFMMGLSPTSSAFGDLNHQEAHPVMLTKDYYIGVFEITQNQWERVMGNRPAFFNNAACYATRPVEQVSYYDIRENPLNQDEPDVNWPLNSAVNTNSFMGKLRAKTGLLDLDLPTEAQWEYACRAGTTTALNSGTELTNAGQDANLSAVGRYYYNGGSGAVQGCSTNAGTAAAGTYMPNAWGLYDFHGNVLEWTLDGWRMNGTNAYPLSIRTTDPAGVRAGTHRLLRGGSWSNLAYECSSASRLFDVPSKRSSKYGFRVASSLPKAAGIDADADGMPDAWETRYGLNPLDPSDASADPDGDGVNNLQEYLNGSSPRNPDTDGDGLSDFDEIYIHRTSPSLADSDGDRMTDGWEVKYGLDPLVAQDGNLDSDGDGLRNWYECLKNTNPFDFDTYGNNRGDWSDWDACFNVMRGIPVTDSNGNGLSDEWEARYPSCVNPTADSDGDGVDNLHEYKAGTDPTKSDTDNDGLSDYHELFVYYTNATKRDTDGDGLSDYDELFVYHTNPLAPDTDGDGLFDGEEIKRFNTDPNAFSSDGSGRADIWPILGGGMDPNFWPSLTENSPGVGGVFLTLSTSLASASSDAVGLLRFGGYTILVQPGCPAERTISLPSAGRSTFTYTPGPGCSTADQPVITVTSASRLAVFNDPGNRIQLEDCFSPLRGVSSVQHPSVFVGGTVEFPPYTIAPDKICSHDPDRCQLSLHSLDLKVRFLVGNELLLKYIPRPPANNQNVTCTITYSDPLAKIFYVPFSVPYCHCQASGAPSGVGSDCFCNCCHICCDCWVDGCTCTPGNCDCTPCTCPDDSNCSCCGALWGAYAPDPSRCSTGCGAADGNCHDEPDWGNKCFTCPACGAHRCGIAHGGGCSYESGAHVITEGNNAATCACLVFPHAYECPCTQKFPDAFQLCPCNHKYDKIIERPHKVLRVGSLDTLPVVLTDGRVCCPNAGCGHAIDKYATSSVTEMKGPVSVSPLSRTTTGDFTNSVSGLSTEIGDAFVACRIYEANSGRNDITYILQHYTVLGLDVYPTALKHTVTNAPYWLQQVMPEPPTDAYLLGKMLNDRNAITFDSKIKLPYDCGTVTVESTGADCYLYVKDQFRSGLPFTNLLSPDQRTATFELGEWRRSYCDSMGIALGHIICTNAGVGAIKITFNTNDGQYEAISVSAEQKFTAISMGFVPDYDRDGVVLQEDINLAKEGKVFTFWVNDDKDDGDFTSHGKDTPSTDFPGQEGANAFDSVVNGRSDLIDFTPMWLDLREVLLTLPPGAGYTYRIRSKGVNVVQTRMPRNESLRNFACRANDQCGPGLNQPSYSASVLPEASDLNEQVAELTPSFLALMVASDAFGVLMAEGAFQGASLALDVVGANGVVLFSSEAPLRFVPVESMYRWINLRSVTGGSEERPTKDGLPLNYPDSECNGKHFIFVHGLNVNEHDARCSGAEMFKRLYHSGSKAMYTAVAWRGNQGQQYYACPPWPPYIGRRTPDYYANVVNAFNTAPALVAAVSALPGEKIISGHSLGNMVVSSAIHDYGLAVTKYFMLNGAVAAEAYDGSRFTPAAADNQMVHDEWRAYLPRTWASCWHTHFTQVTDDRRKLTWRNRFSGVLPVAYNYYSSGDEAFETYETTPIAFQGYDGTKQGTGRYSWSKQELYKGRVNSADPIVSWLTGTDAAGWGFNRAKQYLDGSDSSETVLIWTNVYDLVRANNLLPDELMAIPVFFPSPPDLFNATIDADARNRILAYGIPAISTAIGHERISFEGEDRNINMNALNRPNGWWRLKSTFGVLGERWLHSDMFEVAYCYVYEVFDDFVTRGDL